MFPPSCAGMAIPLLFQPREAAKFLLGRQYNKQPLLGGRIGLYWVAESGCSTCIGAVTRVRGRQMLRA